MLINFSTLQKDYHSRYSWHNMQVLVIGYGNPLREDDGIGWAAAAEIANWHIPNCALHVEQAHQLLPELADPISQADMVIFVDASVKGEAGQITQQTIKPTIGLLTAFTHHFDPAGLLTYAGALYDHVPRAYLFTVTAASLGYKETLSPVVAQALPQLLAQIRDLLAEVVFSGEGGIRTHGDHSGHNAFRERPDQPLRHLSE